MAKDTFYEVEAGRFQITVTEVKPEDATGDLFTSDELFEAHGHRYGGTHFRKELIADMIAAYVGKAKDRGTKTIVIDDVEFADFLKEQAQCGYNMDHFTSIHVRRVDNRLFIQSAEAKAAKLREPNKKDHSHLILVLVQSINRIGNMRKRTRQGLSADDACHSFELSMVYHAWNRIDALELLQKLIKWEEITWPANDDQAMIDRCKQIWDNPAMFEETNEAEEA